MDTNGKDGEESGGAKGGKSDSGLSECEALGKKPPGRRADSVQSRERSPRGSSHGAQEARRRPVLLSSQAERDAVVCSYFRHSETQATHELPLPFPECDSSAYET